MVSPGSTRCSRYVVGTWWKQIPAVTRAPGRMWFTMRAGPLTVHRAEVLQFLQRRRAECPKPLGTWRTQPNRFLCPQPCGYRAQSIATLQTAPDCPSQLDLSWEVLAAPAVPLAASIRPGLEGRGGRGFPARTHSMNCAR